MDNTDLFSVATCSNDPVRINRTFPLYFSTLQAAYSAAVHGDIIQSRDMEFTEDISVNQNMSVTKAEDITAIIQITRDRQSSMVR
jgi:hypothetical protein